MYRIGYAKNGIDWQRINQAILVRQMPAYNSKHVRSPSVLYVGGFAMVAYEAYDGDGLTGIGLDLGRERYLNPSATELVLTSSPGSPDVLETDLRVHNGGIGDLAVNDASILGRGFSLSAPSLPLVLRSNMESPWRVSFDLTQPGSYQGVLFINSNDPLRRSFPILLKAEVE